MVDKPEVLTPDDIVSEEKKQHDDASLVIPENVLPDELMIIPLFDRPTFPKMMGPVIIDDPRIQSLILRHDNEKVPLYVGLVLTRPHDDSLPHQPESKDDFYDVGVVVRVMQISPPTEKNPLQLLVQGIQRFDIIEMKKQKPLFRAKVEYWEAEDDDKNGDDLKA